MKDLLVDEVFHLFPLLRNIIHLVFHDHESLKYYVKATFVLLVQRSL